MDHRDQPVYRDYLGAARAALFPRISLTGLLGLASNALTGLFSGGGFNWSAGADANYSIFNAGAGRANVRFTEAQREAAVATYERAIQSAFREVADGLAARTGLNGQIEAYEGLVNAQQKRFDLADARYKQGVDSYFEVLTAQQDLFDSQRALI